MGCWEFVLQRISDTDIEKCCTVVREELERNGNDISPQLLQCAEQLPHKILLYGRLVGLLNLGNEGFIRKVVENTQFNLQDALNLGNCKRIRILMRFLTVMMCNKVLQPSSLVAVFETLLSAARTVDKKGNPFWQPCADFYVSCILLSLPWGGAELAKRVPEEIYKIMSGVESYFSLRSVSEVGLSCFEDGDETEKGLGVKDYVQTKEGIGEKDLLKELWDLIRLQSHTGWDLYSVPSPYCLIETHKLDSCKSHELGVISCPKQPNLPLTLSEIAIGQQKHDAELKYPKRTRRLNLFPSEIEGLNCFVVEEYFLDFYNGSDNECVSFMKGLDKQLECKYIMAEAIFSQLLLLQHSPFGSLYYTTVIIDLCKALPGFSAIVEKAVLALFEKIDDLDMECRRRLVLWFSDSVIWRSDFQDFQDIMKEWAFVTKLPKWSPKRVFVEEVLDRQVHCSKRIKNVPLLSGLLPPEDGTGKTKEHTLSGKICTMVKSNQTAFKVISVILAVSVDCSEGILKIVVQTLLNIGSKNFTYLRIILERYSRVLSHLCPDEDNQVLLIEEVASYWKDSSQMRAFVIDQMLNYEIVSNLAIVRWVFSPGNIDKFHTSDHPWEVLRNAVNKKYMLISYLRTRIPSLAKSVELAEKDVAKVNADLEAAKDNSTELKCFISDGESAQLECLQSDAEKVKNDEVSVKKTLENMNAYLDLAISENKALLVCLYRSFSEVLNERLPTTQGDAMTVDVSELLAAAEIEDPNTRQLNGEREQWCSSTLGYLKAFSRQYASEIWPIMEELVAEVIKENVHPLFKKEIYSGLGQ